ncbi:MAG: glycosyltransferase [Chitinophagaceae bacterium]
MRKIIIIGPVYPLRGGIAAFNEQLAMELQRRNNQVSLYTYSLQYPSLFFPGKTQYSMDPSPKNLNIHIAINSVNPANWIQVATKIRNQNPDLVIVAYWTSFLSPCLGIIAKLIKKNKKIRIIGLVHNLFPHKKRFFDSLLARFFLKQCDALIALSKDTQSKIKALSPLPTLFSPHPVYDQYGEKLNQREAQSYLGLESNHPYLLFFGLIRNYKGLSLLLKAISDPRIEQKDIHLLIAGEFYEGREEYEKLIRTLSLGRRVHLRAGYIPIEEVKYYFSAADVVIQPYLSATQSGITQIAYHFEQPVIITNVGGLSEFVPDGKAGILVQPDAQSIANGILKFYQYPPDSFTSFLKTEKIKYSWSNFVQDIESLI